MSSQRPPQLMTYVLPAVASPLALVIRRGPSKWWHFLLWDRDTGIVTPGSWFHGLVYPARCDLSPKGDWMVILAFSATNTPPAWTALCRPPSVAAQVFWPLEHAKHGGGFFDGRLPVLWLSFAEQSSSPEQRSRQPWEFGYHEQEKPTWYGGSEERMTRDGWKPLKAPADSPGQIRWRKPSPNKAGELGATFLGTREELLDPAQLFEPGRFAYTYTPAGPGSAPIPIPGVSWAGFNSRGEVCIARNNTLSVRKYQPSGEYSEVPVIDLAGFSPRPPKPRPAAPKPLLPTTEQS